MSYIEITIWNPLRCDFTWKPVYEKWIRDGFEIHWLFISILVSTYKGDA
jgi:hypothetical protein